MSDDPLDGWLGPVLGPAAPEGTYELECGCLVMIHEWSPSSPYALLWFKQECEKEAREHGTVALADMKKLAPT